MWLTHRRRPIALLVLAIAIAAAIAAQEAPSRDWPTARPEAVGLDSGKLSALDTEIAAGTFGHVDSLLVIRSGRLAFERVYTRDYDAIYGVAAKTTSGLNAHHPAGQYNYFNPWWHPYYRRGELHTLQSVTKTITSMVIGAAVTRGEFTSLDTPILKFFGADVKNVDDRKRRVTIRHLLTMTAGFEWRENLPYTDPNNTTVLMEASFDWIRMAIDAPMAAEPGATWNYNSGATQLLAHIFSAVTAKDIEEYAAQHLFAPLGITQWYWKRTPMGLADTEGGLYLHRRDVAKLWYLMLQNGRWNGRTILSPEWIKDSVTPAIRVNAQGVQYGYKWWLHPYGDGKLAWAGSGFGGQFPIAIPDRDLVIVVNGWNALPRGQGLGARVAIDRMLAAVAR